MQTLQMSHFVGFVHSVHLEALSQLQASTRLYIPHIRNKEIAVIRLILTGRGSPNCSAIRMHLLARLGNKREFHKEPNRSFASALVSSGNNNTRTENKK